MIWERIPSRARAAALGGAWLLVGICGTGIVSVAEAQSGGPEWPPDQNPAVVDTGGPTLGAAAAPAGERWSLARVVATALDRNVDVRAAHGRTVQARGSALGAWNGILPSLSGNLGYTHTKRNSASPFVESNSLIPFEDRFDTQSAGLSAQSNLLSVPSWSEKRRQDHLKSGAESNESETRNQVVFDVKQQYFNLVKAERLAQVSAESERLARDEESRAQALFEVGTVARGDVLKAKARHATTRLDLIRANNQVEIQRSRLKQIVGLRPGESIEIEGALDENVSIPDSAASIRTALLRRPLLQSRQEAERAARADLFGARTSRLPSVTGSVDLDRSKNKEHFEIVGVPPDPTQSEEPYYSTDWRSTVQLTLPVFNGFALEGRMKTAKGSVIEAEARRRQGELDVTVEVQQAWLTLREARERIDVARDGLASAEEDYNFSKGRYELGAGTFLDLLNAEVSLSQAKQALIEALADAHVAEASLERAVGERRY